MSLDLAAFVPNRILVCQLRQIGDVLLATPSIELLKRRYPQSEIHVLTEQKCAPILEKNPYVNRIWRLDKHSFTSFWDELRWYWQVASTHFDLVIDFQQLPRCRWVVAFSGARVRLSFTPPWYNRLLYTHSIKTLDGYAAMSKASVLIPLGIHYTTERPKLYLSNQEKSNAASLLYSLGLREGNKLLTLDPTHRRITRRWALASYAKTLQLLVEQDKSWRFLPLWGPGEEHDIQNLYVLCKSIKEHLLIPRKMLSLREMAACIATAKLHLGNCSAPRHIAVAVDTPSCIIRGSTSESWTYPSPKHMSIAANLDCQPCNKDYCPKHTNLCLTSVQPEEVVEKIYRTK